MKKQNKSHNSLASNYKHSVFSILRLKLNMLVWLLKKHYIQKTCIHLIRIKGKKSRHEVDFTQIILPWRIKPANEKNNKFKHKVILMEEY